MSELGQIAASVGHAVAILIRDAQFVNEKSNSLTIKKDGFLNCIIRLQRLRDSIEALESNQHPARTDKILAQSEHIRRLTKIAETFRTKAYSTAPDRDGMIPRAKLVELLESFTRQYEDESENYAAGCAARARKIIREDASERRAVA